MNNGVKSLSNIVKSSNKTCSCSEVSPTIFPSSKYKFSLKLLYTCFERVSNQLIRPTRQRAFSREVDKFRAVDYRPVYKLNRVQSCPRADIVSLFVLI